MVCNAGDDDSKTRQSALESLCENYWYPLYSFARRKVQQREQAEDLIQSFFATLLEKNIVASADSGRGRFRAFLITSLKNHMANEWHKQNAAKRGGSRKLLSLDFDQGDSKYAIEPSTTLTPEQLFDRSWAITLLNRVLERLESDQETFGKGDQFRALKPYLLGNAPSSYADVAAELNLSEGAAKMAVSRLRKNYRDTLRAEIAHTVNDEDEIEDEIRDLFRAMA